MNYYQFGHVRIADFMMDDASMEELEELSQELSRVHGYEIPASYLDFTRKMIGPQ